MKEESDFYPYIALGSRLKGVPEVLTLGVRPNFHDYTSEEQEIILSSNLILYPTLNYAQFFYTMGKKIFPSLETYLYADEKIKQTTLFYLLDIPHPFTKIYYHLHHEDILKDFSFPFIAKLPRRSSQGRGIFKITNSAELDAYLRLSNIAYIQEYMPHTKDLRIILINYSPILAYWRKSADQNFKTNIFQGGRFDFENIPNDVLNLAQMYAKRCRLNDVGIDMMNVKGKWYVIEANMKYGRKGLRLMGMDLKDVIRNKLLAGEIHGI